MSWKRGVLSVANRLGSRMPRRLLRLIADFPGMLPLFVRLSRESIIAIDTPEAVPLFINPLFHANLAVSGDLSGYEPDMRKAFGVLTRPGMTAYDIGANVGIFSVLLSTLVGEHGRVYAFEPEPNNYACLERTARHPRLRNLTVDHRAVAAVTGSSRFDRRGGAFSGRLLGGHDHYRATRNSVTVETVCLDDAIDRGELPPPDIVKIDVEGNEGLVLQGLRRTLQRHGPVVICELHGHLGDSIDSALGLLREAQYEVALLPDVAAGHWRPLERTEGSAAGHVVARKASAG